MHIILYTAYTCIYVIMCYTYCSFLSVHKLFSRPPIHMCLNAITRYSSTLYNYRDCIGCFPILPYLRKFLFSLSILCCRLLHCYITILRKSAQPNTTQHNTTQLNTTQHHTTQLNTTQHNSTQHNSTQHNSTQHNTTQHNTTQHNTTQHNTTQHNTTQHNTTQLNTTQLNTTQHNSTQLNTTSHNSTPHNTTQTPSQPFCQRNTNLNSQYTRRVCALPTQLPDTCSRGGHASQGKAKQSKHLLFERQTFVHTNK